MNDTAAKTKSSAITQDLNRLRELAEVLPHAVTLVPVSAGEALPKLLLQAQIEVTEAAAKLCAEQVELASDTMRRMNRAAGDRRVG